MRASAVRIAVPEPGVIVMAGPGTQAPGGISAVVQTLLDAGLQERWPVQLLPTWRAGPLPVRTAAAVEAFWRLHNALTQGHVQALHLHAAGRGSFWRKTALAMLARAHGKPVILHLHDGSFLPWWMTQPAPLRHRIRCELQSAHALVVLDEQWAHTYAALAPGARIRVLHNPVTVDPAEGPRQTPVHGRVLFLSRLWPSKGIDELLQATAALRTRFPQLLLQCAGDGDLQAIRRRAAELQLQDRLDLPGWLEGAAKRAALAQAQIFVLPSWAEGQPVAALEAMAMGTPVLASAVGGLPGLLADGAGVLVPPRDVRALSDALAWMLREPDRCRAIGQAGRARAMERHEATRVLDQLGALYRGLGLQPRRVAAEPDGELR